MKLTTEARALAAAADKIAALIKPRQQIPILGHVWLRAAGEQVHLYATDMEAGIAVAIPAEIAVEGDTTVPAGALRAAAKQAADGAEIEIAADASRASAKTATAAFDMPVLPAEDFPKPPPMDDDAACLDVGGAALRELLGGTGFAARAGGGRPYLEGVCIAPKAGVLAAVVSDGHRMAFTEHACPSAAAAAFEPIILPVEAARAAMQLFTGDVAAAITPGRAEFAADGVRMWTRLIDATFPLSHCQHYLDIEMDAGAEIDRDSLIAALDAATKFASSDNTSPVVRIDRDGDRYTLRNHPRCEVRVELAIDATSVGDGWPDCGINAQYLAGMCNLLSSEVLVVEWSSDDGLGPWRFSGQGGQDAARIGIIMPTRW